MAAAGRGLADRAGGGAGEQLAVPGTSGHGNVGLLKDNGNLQWPQALQGEVFKEAREDINRRMKQAVQTVTAGNKSPDESTLADMQARTTGPRTLSTEALTCPCP
jgi:hypothetical protein